MLIVEDDPMVRELAIRVLKDHGYNVLVASNGEEALIVVEEHQGERIHLLITDIVMPAMGGKALSRSISSLMTGIKTLFVSGYAGEAVVVNHVLSADMPFLQKPFTPASLARKVRDVLDSVSEK